MHSCNHGPIAAPLCRHTPLTGAEPQPTRVTKRQQTDAVLRTGPAARAALSCGSPGVPNRVGAAKSELNTVGRVPLDEGLAPDWVPDGSGRRCRTVALDDELGLVRDPGRSRLRTQWLLAPRSARRRAPRTSTPLPGDVISCDHVREPAPGSWGGLRRDLGAAGTRVRLRTHRMCNGTYENWARRAAVCSRRSRTSSAMAACRSTKTSARTCLSAAAHLIRSWRRRAAAVCSSWCRARAARRCACCCCRTCRVRSCREGADIGWRVLLSFCPSVQRPSEQQLLQLEAVRAEFSS